MGLYRQSGSNVYAIDFVYHGRRIRKTTGMTNKKRAQEVFDKFKQDLKDRKAGIRGKKQPDFLADAAERWKSTQQAKWAPKTLDMVECSMAHLLPKMGRLLLVEIEAEDIARYQAARLAEGASNRTTNIEVGMLRKIMRKYGAWDRLKEDVTMLKERDDVGQALTAEQQRVLLFECGQSTSRTLLPFVMLAIETGARYNTIRTLQWGNIDFVNRCLKFGKDKTASGTGRSVPLSRRALDTLRFWAQEFPNRQPADFVFPSEKYGLHGTKGTFGGTVKVYDFDPKTPVGTIQSAWESAKKRTQRHCPNCADGTLVDREKPAAGFVCESCQFELPELPAGLTRLRFHDLRHTAVSRMISAGTPLPIIAKVVGWSASTMAKMAARYGHFGIEDMRSAVESISITEKADSVIEVPRFSPRPDDENTVTLN